MNAAGEFRLYLSSKNTPFQQGILVSQVSFTADVLRELPVLRQIIKAHSLAAVEIRIKF